MSYLHHRLSIIIDATMAAYSSAAIIYRAFYDRFKSLLVIAFLQPHVHTLETYTEHTLESSTRAHSRTRLLQSSAKSRLCLKAFVEHLSFHFLALFPSLCLLRSLTLLPAEADSVSARLQRHSDQSRTSHSV